MSKFAWITNGELDYLQFETHKRLDRFLPVKSEREVLIALTAFFFDNPSAGAPNDAEEMNIDVERFETVMQPGDCDVDLMCERAEAILGYDALTEWNLGTVRPFSRSALTAKTLRAGGCRV